MVDIPVTAFSKGWYSRVVRHKASTDVARAKVRTQLSDVSRGIGPWIAFVGLSDNARGPG